MCRRLFLYFFRRVIANGTQEVNNDQRWVNEAAEEKARPTQIDARIQHPVVLYVRGAALGFALRASKDFPFRVGEPIAHMFVEKGDEM